jgi:hypothetical protein
VAIGRHSHAGVSQHSDLHAEVSAQHGGGGTNEERHGGQRGAQHDLLGVRGGDGVEGEENHAERSHEYKHVHVLGAQEAIGAVADGVADEDHLLLNYLFLLSVDVRTASGT